MPRILQLGELRSEYGFVEGFGPLHVLHIDFEPAHGVVHCDFIHDYLLSSNKDFRVLELLVAFDCRLILIFADFADFRLLYRHH